MAVLQGNFKNKNSDILFPSIRLVSTQQIFSTPLGPNDTAQLTLPTNCCFVEPLFKNHGSEHSGGNFVVPGAAYTYCVCSDEDVQNSSYRGVFVVVTSGGELRISSYRHSGNVINGVRMWYIQYMV